MKIFACCNWQLKFLGPILDYWRNQGHEVKYEMGYNPNLHQWSDVCFIDVCDNNAIEASRRKFDNSQLVIRGIDIECWVGNPGGVNWDNVNGLIFGAKHIENLVRSYVDLPNTAIVKHVPFGIDPDLWTYQERDGSGRNIANICHRWTAKGLPLLLQVMAKLGPGWKLHLLGTKSNERWLHTYLDQQINNLQLDVTITDHVESVNDWLEDKDFLLMSGYKETFLYVVAEAAAKGIKPVIHRFYGADDIWPQEWLWDTVDEAVNQIKSPDYRSDMYRGYISANYTLERMMTGINEVCGLDSQQ